MYDMKVNVIGSSEFYAKKETSDLNEELLSEWFLVGPTECILTQSISLLNSLQQFHTIVPKQL